jgi:drug/metabolite transporter (DMT)-like permease
MPSVQKNPAAPLLVVLAFAAIYLLWGSTYIFIKWGIVTIPPMILAGARHLIAGAMLYAWVRGRGAEKPRPEHWASAVVLGALMLFGGNGGVTWAQQTVPSSIAALIIAAVPMWMTLLDWLRPRGHRPGPLVMAGLILGFGGIVLLIGPGWLGGSDRVPLAGALVLLLASLCWAFGSLLSRHLKLPSALLLSIAMQSVAGGALLLMAAYPAGNWARFDWAAVSLRSVLSLAYLVAFGSLVGFTCYIWLLQVTTAARVATYAYVNPLVALFLGWSLGGEAVSSRSLVATGIIISAVVMIVSHRDKVAAPGEEESPVLKAETADLGCAPSSPRDQAAT